VIAREDAKTGFFLLAPYMCIMFALIHTASDFF
jgi:hypothetical protein